MHTKCAAAARGTPAKGGSLVAVWAFVGLATRQQRTQRSRSRTFCSTQRVDVIDLLLVVMVDEALDRGNRPEDRAHSGQRRQRTEEIVRQAPRHEQPTALRPGPEQCDQAQVLTLGGPVPLRERTHARTPESRVTASTPRKIHTAPVSPGWPPRRLSGR